MTGSRSSKPIPAPFAPRSPRAPRTAPRADAHAAPLLILFACLAALAGCSAFARKTPTPAAKVRIEELDRIPAPPNERYYILVFGSQTFPKWPSQSHTWATVVKVVSDPRNPDAPPALKADTISWMPESLVVRPWSFEAEPGVNLGLHESMRLAVERNQRIALWGPYEIRPGLHRKFLMQKQFLESGAVGYQCVDNVGEAALRGNATDCIHAITDADAELDRDGYPLLFYGEDASRIIANRLRRKGALVNPDRVHNELVPALGLDRYPIVRRD